MQDAGRVLIMPRGEYNAAETYEFLDTVEYASTLWVARKSVTGVTPTVGEYWQILMHTSGTTFTYSSSLGSEQVKVASSSEGTFSLYVGCFIGVKYENTSTYDATAENPCKLNVDDTGSKPIYYGNSIPVGVNTNACGTAGRITYYMYDGTNWVWAGQSLDTDTTYTNASLGQGYGESATEEATLAKVATVAGYELVVGGIVAVKFENNVPANSTLNINSKGAIPMTYRGVAIADDVLRHGYIGSFMYDGTSYILISVDTGTGGAVRAEDLDYDNTDSGLEATNAQDAIDEIASRMQVVYVPATKTISIPSTVAEYRSATNTIVLK